MIIPLPPPLSLAGNDLVDETSLIVAAIIVVVNDDATATHRHRHQ